MVEDCGDVCRAKKSTTINQSPWNVAPGKEWDSWFLTVVRRILVVINYLCMVARSDTQRCIHFHMNIIVQSCSEDRKAMLNQLVRTSRQTFLQLSLLAIQG
jgi:hypothetical protein